MTAERVTGWGSREGRATTTPGTTAKQRNSDDDHNKSTSNENTDSSTKTCIAMKRQHPGNRSTPPTSLIPEQADEHAYMSKISKLQYSTHISICLYPTRSAINATSPKIANSMKNRQAVGKRNRLREDSIAVARQELEQIDPCPSVDRFSQAEPKQEISHFAHDKRCLL